MLPAAQIDAIAHEIRAAQDAVRQIEPLAARHPGLDLDTAYEIAACVHRARLAEGAVVRGRKIGFTNANMWPVYGVHQPMWGYVYEHTLVRGVGGAVDFGLEKLAEPKIEPEIAFGLRAPPPPGADMATLIGCIDWVAPAFELVQSHFPSWKFQAADTIADGGLHGALLLGDPQPLGRLGSDPVGALADFSLALFCDGVEMEMGHGRNVLGNPLTALLHLVGLLAARSPEYALRPGEIITTGTLTAAWPVRTGQSWRFEPRGIALAPVSVNFTLP